MTAPANAHSCAFVDDVAPCPPDCMQERRDGEAERGREELRKGYGSLGRTGMARQSHRLFEREIRFPLAAETALNVTFGAIRHWL